MNKIKKNRISNVETFPNEQIMSTHTSISWMDENVHRISVSALRGNITCNIVNGHHYSKYSPLSTSLSFRGNPSWLNQYTNTVSLASTLNLSQANSLPCRLALLACPNNASSWSPATRKTAIQDVQKAAQWAGNWRRPRRRQTTWRGDTNRERRHWPIRFGVGLNWSALKRWLLAPGTRFKCRVQQGGSGGQREITRMDIEVLTSLGGATAGSLSFLSFEFSKPTSRPAYFAKSASWKEEKKTKRK